MKNIKISEEAHAKLKAILDAADTAFFPKNPNATLFTQSSGGVVVARFLTVCQDEHDRDLLVNNFGLRATKTVAVWRDGLKLHVVESGEHVKEPRSHVIKCDTAAAAQEFERIINHGVIKLGRTFDDIIKYVYADANRRLVKTLKYATVGRVGIHINIAEFSGYEIPEQGTTLECPSEDEASALETLLKTGIDKKGWSFAECVSFALDNRLAVRFETAPEVASQ